MLIGQPAMRPQRWGDQRVLIGRGDGKAPDRVVRGCWLSGCSVGADCWGPSVCIGWVPVGGGTGCTWMPTLRAPYGCRHWVLHERRRQVLFGYCYWVLMSSDAGRWHQVHVDANTGCSMGADIGCSVNADIGCSVSADTGC